MQAAAADGEQQGVSTPHLTYFKKGKVTYNRDDKIGDFTSELSFTREFYSRSKQLPSMITSIIKQHIESKLEALNLDSTPTIEIPKKGDAHLAMPLFVYAKSLKLAPLQIFEHFKSLILPHEYIEDVAFLNGFLNIYLKKDIVGKAILDQVLREKNQYGQVKQATNEVVVIDYSSPNIAKSFSVGHLRSTVIGNALKNIYQKNGYETVGINYLGDWGTQFGKMIVAYQKWGDKQKNCLKSNC